MLSVVIPSYNCEKTIGKCLDSIIAEKIKMEIVIINDGSTDNTKKIIEEYQSKHDNIKMISKKNEGISPTRNVCIRESCGELILFIDSDVVIEKGCIKKMLKYADKNDIIYPTLNFEPGGTIHPIRPQEFLYPHISAIVMIKRSVFDKVGYFDEAFTSYAEETDLFLRCILKNITAKYVDTATATHLDVDYNHLKRQALECKNIPYGYLKWRGEDIKKIKEKFYFSFTIKYIIILYGFSFLNLNPFGWEIYMKRQNSFFVFAWQIIKHNKKFTERRDIKSFFILNKLFFVNFIEGVRCGLKERKK